MSAAQTPRPDDRPSKGLRLELEQRRNDLHRLADEVRVQLHLGGMEAKDAWQRLQPKVEDFERKAEEVTEELVKELQHVGETLKTELQALRDRLAERR